MINKVDFNILNFTRNYADRFQNKYLLSGDELLFFDQDRFTSFQIDLKFMGETDIANLNIRLVNSENEDSTIDLKTLVADSEIIYENYMLYYLASKIFNENISGCYYLQIDNGAEFIYTNTFRFSNLGYATLQGDGSIIYTKTNTSTPLEIILTSSEDVDILVNYGDGTQEVKTVTTSSVSFNKTYSTNADFIISLGGSLGLITDIFINNDSITEIETLSDFTNLEELNLDECSILTAPLAGLINLETYKINNTNIVSLSGFFATKGQNLECNSCIGIELNDQGFASLGTKLKTISATGCNITTVSGANTSDGWTQLQDFNLSNNQLTRIPVLVDNTGVSALTATIRTVDLSLNAIDGNPSVDAYKTSAGLVFFSRIEELNLSYNSISEQYIDDILELLAFASITAARPSLSVDLTGFNKVLTGNPANDAPSNRITNYEPILVAGSGYVVGDVLNVTGGGGTGASISVSGIDGIGGVTSYDVETYGSGYTSPAISNSGGSGTGVSILVKSAKVRLTDDGAIVLTN